MSQAFLDICKELSDDPEKLAKFVKLYNNDDTVQDIYCKICDKDITNNYNHFKSDGICGQVCEDFQQYVLENKDINEYLNCISNIQFPKVLEQHTQKIYNWLNIIFKNNNKYANNELIKNNLLVLFNHPFSKQIFVNGLSRFPEYDNLYKDNIQLNEIQFVSGYNENLLIYLFNKFGKDEIKKLEYPEDSITQELIYKCLTKALRNSDNLGNVLFRRPIAKKLLTQFLEPTDIKFCDEMEEQVKFLIGKFGVKKLQENEPYKYIKSHTELKLIYKEEDINDDMIMYWIEKSYIPWYYVNMIKYKVKDKNRFFTSLKKENFPKWLLDDYYEGSYHIDFFQFIYDNVKVLKKGDITKETLYTFFNNMKSTGLNFRLYMKKMLTLFDDLDMSYSVNLENNKSISFIDIAFDILEVNISLIKKIKEQKILIKDETIEKLKKYLTYSNTKEKAEIILTTLDITY